MAKGYDNYHARLSDLNLLGKDLTRRAKSCCELCEASGVKLTIYEVPPVPVEPELDQCLLLCQTCYEQLNRPKSIQADHWRCLTKTMWSTLPAAQVIAIRMLKFLAVQADWAAELLEQVYLEPEIAEQVDQASINEKK
ncbi:phnA protein [Endozoicomonas sp. SM1973]|uniref:PhnA protein n=1 Tax=Spartinivicinus marinus TaxID=2994442 RepID=A0A853IMR3_9GAMM|nr:phnA protein [Spartinivicinus marinus]MCX4028673.1 phnA protein [Spartinivicinus marinus]NYZ69086.1 phnA protein [Spartinivicinus marinus]